jgi:ankyrin repeat protein
MIEKDPSLAKSPFEGNPFRGRTPLHFAATGEMVEILVGAGADVMVRDSVGLTPLHTTTTAEAADALIYAGAEVMDENPKGLTPLHKAANAEVAEVLIQNGAEVNYVKVSGWYDRARNQVPLKDTPLYWAILDGRVDVVRVLLEYGADAQQQLPKERTLLHHAARYSNKPEIIDLLLEYIEVNATDEFNATPLHLASVHNKLRTAERLSRA